MALSNMWSVKTVRRASNSKVLSRICVYFNVSISLRYIYSITCIYCYTSAVCVYTNIKDLFIIIFTWFLTHLASPFVEYFSRGRMNSWSGTQKTLTKSNKFLYRRRTCGCLTSSSMSCKSCCCWRHCFCCHSAACLRPLKQVVVTFISNLQCRCGEVSRHTLCLRDT